MTILIVANGEIDGADWLRPYLERASAVIAADGGVRHLLHLGHRPDAIIGDLDSGPPEGQHWIDNDAVTVFTYPRDKNETDLELALLHTVGHSAEPIQIAGAFGGRLDQTLGNIMLLAHPQLIGRQVELLTEHQRVWLVRDQAEIVGQIGDKVSLIPLGGDVMIKETSGLKWPLENEVLAFGPARGISNEMIEPIARIELIDGELICVHTEGSWMR